MSFKTTANALVDQLWSLAMGQRPPSPDLEEPSETGPSWQVISKSEGMPVRSTNAQRGRNEAQIQHAAHCPASQRNSEGKEILSQSQCLLFTLPTEIRLAIYELVMFQAPSSKPASRRTPSVLELLRTCRRILSEAEPLFFSRGQFALSRERLQSLAHLSSRRRSAITSVAVTITSAGQTLEVLTKLAVLPKLKSLHLNRAMSARYMNMSEWRMMKKQHVAVIGGFSELAELLVTTPEIGPGASDHEIAVDQQRIQIEAEWKGAVKNVK